MKFLVVVSCLLAVAYAKPGFLAGPAVAYSAAAPGAFDYSYSTHLTAPVVAHSAVVAPIAHSAIIAPYAHTAVVAALEKTQYHAQDGFGQAAYGHAEAYQTHNAVQDAGGNKVGSYSYVAPDGQVIATNYVADALGYRVASNAVPAETPEVVAARAAHLQEVENVKHRSRRSPILATVPLAYTSPLAYSHPITYSSPFVARTGLSHVVAAPHVYTRYY